MFNINSTLLARYFVVMVLPTIILFVPPAEAQQPSSPPSEHSHDGHEEEYHENALRRFEIITLSSLPFTAIHSYLGVRVVRMVQENKIAPVLTQKNYRVMGISAVSLSLFIGIWDWLHTRNVDTSEPSIPEWKPSTPPTEEGITPEGPIAIIPSNAQHVMMNNASTFIGQPHLMQQNYQLNIGGTGPSEGLVIPLLQIRF
ncbi:hypothetical protein F4X73_17075 [Candidatus Poribacteria bacterium]|nr:hypothetical protein [Candidatus Poribacteria bacterium]MYF54381.1 hypothetical protein [Candidatus Poribacteria bacterium]